MEVQDVIIDSCQDKLDKLENKLCKSKNDALAVLKIDLVQKFDLLSNKIEKLEDAEKKFTEKFQSDEVNPINTCTTNGNGRTKIKTKNHNCSPTVKINSNAEMESKKRKISTSLILDSNSNSINEPAAGLEENGHLRQQISHSDITKALSCNQNLNKKDDETENKQNNKIIDVCEQAKKIMYGNEALTINQWRDVEFTTPTPGCNSTLSSMLYDEPREELCNGNDVIKSFNFNPVNTIVNLNLRLEIHSLLFSRISFYEIFYCWLP